MSCTHSNRRWGMLPEELENLITGEAFREVVCFSNLRTRVGRKVVLVESNFWWVGQGEPTGSPESCARRRFTSSRKQGTSSWYLRSVFGCASAQLAHTE
eukprot:6491757-Amphidinium_carterae.1